MGTRVGRTVCAVAALAAIVAGTGIVFFGQDPWRGLSGDVVGEAIGATPSRVTIEIGGEFLNLPPELVRFSNQRKPGPKPRVDLALVWPSLGPLDTERAGATETADPSSPVVFVGIEPRENALDTSSRVATVYSRFFAGDQFEGPAGLVGRRMKAGSGYDDELIFFEPGSVRPFAARCFALKQETVATVCLREVLIGRNLVATYRFRFGLLQSWPELDERMSALFDDFLRGSP